MQQEIPNLSSILFFSLWAVLTNIIAKSRGFFRFSRTPSPALPMRLRQLVCVFGLYLIFSVFIPLSLGKILTTLSGQQVSLSLVTADWIELILSLALFFALTFYLSRSNRELFKKIWKDTSIPGRERISKDFLVGASTWLLSFPIIAVVSQLCDFILYYYFGAEHYEQVAVKLLKKALQTPSALPAVLILILVMAPAIEEFLFRGCLQTWLKRLLGAKAAILLTALIFALFHFSLSQGLGNISLVLSLFFFSCYLGFIYEKQASLFASIGLHFTFNATSVLFILFQVEV